MGFNFGEVTEAASYLRIALSGASGSGKTYSALRIALGITAGDAGKIGVIDTERGSAAKYKKLGKFLHGNLDNFHPRNYVEAIDAYVKAGVEVIVVDSLTHAWEGTGGVLQIVEAQKKNSTNQYTAWAEGTKWQNRLVDALLQAPVHLIVTMRSKPETILEGGKPVTIGTKSIQREGMEYEFDLAGQFYGREHTLLITKTRFSDLDGLEIDRPGESFGSKLVELLGDTEIVSRMVAIEPEEAVEADDEPPIDKPSAYNLLAVYEPQLSEAAFNIANDYTKATSRKDIAALDRKVASEVKAMPQEIRNTIREVRDARWNEVA